MPNKKEISISSRNRQFNTGDYSDQFYLIQKPESRARTIPLSCVGLKYWPIWYKYVALKELQFVLFYFSPTPAISAPA